MTYRTPWPALAVLLLVASPAFAQRDQRTFRDWRAVHGASMSGWAATSERNPNGAARLEVLRGAEPRSHLAVVTEPALDPGRPVTFTLDGQARTVPPGGLVARDAPEALTLQHAETLAFLQSGLRNAKLLEVSGQTAAGGRIRAEFGLAGLAASLLWLDERQGRVGRPSPLAPIEPPRPGPFHGDGQAVVEPGEIPVRVALPAREALTQGLRDAPPAVLERHAMLGGCSAGALAGSEPRLWTARLDPWNTLYGVTCWSAAYNQGDRLYLVQNGDFRGLQPLAFAEPDGVDGWDATDVLVNPGFDPRSGTLQSFNKGRGAGDCGTVGTWAWTGSRFSLREYRSEPTCNGRPQEAWPVIYRSKPR